MGIYFLAPLFILGLIAGSFLNAVIYRYNTGITLSGRSFCPNCGKNLKWFELIPLFSFIFQFARCRTCRGKISWQYPFVEIITAFLFAATGYKLGMVFDAWSLFYFLYILAVWCFFMVISVYDLRHKIIPDAPVYALIFLSLVWQISSFLKGASGALDLIIGPFLFLTIASFWLVSSGRWMGFGDAKLVLGIGWFLGLKGGISGVILGFWLGALAGILLVVASRAGKLFLGSEKFTMKSEIPFGPFLIAGATLAFFFNLDVLSFSAFIK